MLLDVHKVSITHVALTMFVISLVWTPSSVAQERKSTPAQVARVEQPEGPYSSSTAEPDPTIKVKSDTSKYADPAEVEKELEAMKARIAQLEEQLKESREGKAAEGKTLPASSYVNTESTARDVVIDQAETPKANAPQAAPEPAEPFAYADWTWLNGTARNKDAVWDSKFFTPEIRFDTHFVHSFNHPKDDSMGGSSEIFRSNEFQVEQISFGGDFHWQNVRGRVLTMGGMFAVTTPRNDASPLRGQWDLRGAYKYFSEAYGGYHFDVNHGLNIDAGIFVSYIGLFSYYNFDNWAYQPSFVSSNTPWFFNGLRIQWFPTDKLKIEPWIINGWQSYGRFGSKPGLGGQILWRPKPWLSLVFNNYGMGEDTLGSPAGLNGLGRSRIHTDDSIEVKYYDQKEKFLDKAAFSFTADAGCEYGGGVACTTNKKDASGNITAYKQAFLGWMLYNRTWFKKDLYGLTIGGGAMTNPGRYLTLLPPINGADAEFGSPYFSQSPGNQFKAWDASITFDWMPKQYITFRTEYGYRHANVPYWSGPGGITPPGGNNFTNGVGGVVPGTTFVPGPLFSATQGSTCVAGATGWCPDLRKDEASARFAIMVKF